MVFYFIRLKPHNFSFQTFSTLALTEMDLLALILTLTIFQRVKYFRVFAQSTMQTTIQT